MPVAMWVEVLRRVPLFEDVSERHLRKIANLGSIRRYVPGAPILRAGSTGDACYIVLDGRAEVRLRPGRPGIAVGVGDVIGEMALLDDAPRSADAVAETELVCFTLPRTSFKRLLRDEPTVTLVLLQTLAGRLRALQGTG